MTSRELKPTAEHVTCHVCNRTMLKGERAEPYLTPSRERKLVCALCAPRAQREGWIRESVAPETPTRPARNSERGGLLRRMRRRREAEGSPSAQTDQVPEAEPGAGREEMTASGSEAAGPRDPRQVHAVPTNAQLKLDRATEVFNESEHRRTIAGLARTLGAPQVSALPTSAAEVSLTIAWELAWYQFAIDLSDPREPVQLRARGEELEELPEQARAWNAQVLADGALALGTAAADTGTDAPAGSDP